MIRALCALGVVLLSVMCSVCLADASAFSVGRNYRGQTGLGFASNGTTPLATPLVATNLGGRSISQVAAGVVHSLVLTADGAVFSFGDNLWGETGLNTATGSTLVATPIDASNLAGKGITQIAAGSAHSLLLADDGTVFAFGSNDNGATGQGVWGGSTLVATPIDATNLGGKKISQVAAGDYHSLLLTDDGVVFAFGANFYGEIGVAGATTIATAIDASNLGGKKIKQVAAGRFHSLLLAEDGTVFSFGSNGGGRTGLNTESGDTPIATPIDLTSLAGKSVAQVAAGGSHSLLLADDGTVYSFGANSSGQTGLNTASGNTLVATPIDATNLGGKVISQVSASGFHSMLLASDGTAFAFGDNYWDQTGLNLAADEVLVAAPIDAANFGGKAVMQVAAGSFHSLLLVKEVPEPAAAALVLFAFVPLLVSRRARARGIGLSSLNEVDSRGRQAGSLGG